jgi:hypothetical protein
MFTDERRHKVWEQFRQLDLRAFGKLLPMERFAQAAQRAKVRLGRGPLCLPTLVWLALSAARFKTKSFASLLTVTLRILLDVPGWNETPLARRCGESQAKKSKAREKAKRRSKHDPRGTNAGRVSEEAFVQARQRMPLEFWMQLLMVLGEQFQAQHADAIVWNGFRLLALDGTLVRLQHRSQLAKHFGTTRNGKRRRTPQARMVMLAFPLARIPYRYELTPLSCHELTSAEKLVGHLQAGDLLLMDRGFWCFSLFGQILQQQAHFAIRLRRRTPLKTVRRLGANDRIVEWTPAKTSKKRRPKREGLSKSIRLRVIEYRLPGFRPSAVVTSVLDPRRVSAEDWTRMATRDEAGRVIEPGLYHRRWEIETMFRELKVQQGLVQSLRSRTPKGIEFEIAGHMLLYLLTRWLMVEAAKEHGDDPIRLSFTHALEALEDMRQTLLIASPQRVAQVLLPRLLIRIAEHRVPFRPGRHYPRPNDHYKLGKYRQRSKLVTKKT